MPLLLVFLVVACVLACSFSSCSFGLVLLYSLARAVFFGLSFLACSFSFFSFEKIQQPVALGV